MKKVEMISIFSALLLVISSLTACSVIEKDTLSKVLNSHIKQAGGFQIKQSIEGEQEKGDTRSATGSQYNLIHPAPATDVAPAERITAKSENSSSVSRADGTIVMLPGAWEEETDAAHVLSKAGADDEDADPSGPPVLKGDGGPADKEEEQASEPEKIEVLTEETAKPLPLEEPSSPEDMVKEGEAPEVKISEAKVTVPEEPLVELQMDIAHDIPVVVNKQVKKYLIYFQTKGRRDFARWLARSTRYLPMIKELLAENGLPEDLAYMAMIESGFNPRAYSRSHASGLWQFIASTAKKYGLKVNWWVDERRDPEKATVAAIKYLKDLYEIFGSWYLVAASYNAGEAKVSKEIGRRKTKDFWVLHRRSRLRRETKEYVPKFLAAMIIAKNPEKYGFTDVKYQKPLNFDRVLVSGSIDLRLIASACGTTYKKLRELNPELRHWITPPSPSKYSIKIPTNTGEKLYAFLNSRLPKLKKVVYGKYTIRKGDTVYDIARKFGVSTSSILQVNNIVNPRRLLPGRRIIIPAYPTRRRVSTYLARLSSSNDHGSNRATVDPETGHIIYKVQPNDTLWDISRAYNVNLKDIMRVNMIGNPRRLRPGTIILIPDGSKPPRPVPASTKELKPASESFIIYRVRRGDSLWKIARRFGVRLEDLFLWNNMTANTIIRPGDKIRIKRQRSSEL